MFFLQLLVVFSVFLSTQQKVENDCKHDLKLNYETNLTDNWRQCTSAHELRIFERRERETATEDVKTLEVLNSLQMINSSNETYRHYVSLYIRGTYLKYTPETFLPNLTRIIRAPKSTSSAIHIHGNRALCIPEDVKTKLLNMIDDWGYIQPCACYVKLNEDFSRIDEIVGDKCVTLHGPLGFVNNSIMTEKMRKQLETVEELYGFIIIENTDFTSLDFLKNLKKVIYPKDYVKTYEHTTVVQITNNPNMTRLGFLLDIVQDETKMTSRDHSILIIEGNPLLKFDTNEKQYYINFIRTEMDFKSPEDPVWIDPGPCELVEPLSKNINSVKDCFYVAGNLTIDSSFDDYSLEEMDEIFGNVFVLRGCLTIHGTKLTNLTFLHDLVLVNCLAQRPAIIIEDNPELKMLDVQIYEFEDSVSPVTIKIKNNPKLCPPEVDYLKTIMNSPWRLIEFDRWEQLCEDASQHSSDWLPYYYAIGAGILVVGMFALEGMVQLVENRRQKRADRPEIHG